MSAHIKRHEIHVSSLLRIPQTDPTDAVPSVVRSVLLWTFAGRSALEPKQILKGYCSSLCFCKYGNPLELGQVRIDWLKHKHVCMCVCMHITDTYTPLASSWGIFRKPPSFLSSLALALLPPCQGYHRLSFLPLSVHIWVFLLFPHRSESS